MPTKRPLHILILEDNPNDVELVFAALSQAGIEYDAVQVDSEIDFVAHLGDNLDLILSDYTVPPFDALQALQLMQGRGLDIPFIIITGTVAEETIIECMKQGAADYLLKDRLTRLGQAVERALKQKQLRDERSQVEAALQESEKRYRLLFDNASLGIGYFTAKGQVLSFNKVAAAYMGGIPADFAGATLFDLYGEEAGALYLGRITAALQSEMSKTYEERMELPTGEQWMRSTYSRIVDDSGAVTGVQVISSDITERRRTEKALEQERHLLRTLIDNLPDRIYAKDTEGRFTLKNIADARQMGATTTDAVFGKTDFDYYPPVLAERYHADDQAVIQSGQALINREEPFISADGTRGWILTSKVPLRDNLGNVIGLVGIGRDITERKRAEEELRTLNRTLALLSDVNQAIVRIRSISALFEHVCYIAVERGGFRLAWVGLLDAATGKLNAVAHVGKDEGYSEKLALMLRDEPRRDGPTDRALRTGEYAIVNDVEHAPYPAPLHEDAIGLGFRAVASFPLKVGGEVRGAFSLYADMPGFFDDKELKLLDEMASDISFAMEFAEQEEQRKQAELQLQAAHDTLEARVVERTLELSRAKERVEAILSNSPDAVLLVSSDLRLRQANAAFNRLFACETDDYFNQSLLSLVPVEDTNLLLEIVQAVRADGQGKHLDVRARRKDATVFDASLNIGPISDAGIICTMRDITERKAMERQLRYAASLQESVVDAVIATDTEFRILSWNQGAERIYGWTADEAIGKLAPELLYIRFPPASDWEAARKHFTEQGSLQDETIQRRKDGTDITILGSATRLVDDKGVPVGIISVNRDITERKAQERQLLYHASLQENVTDAVIATDLEFRIQSWNRAAERIYGWTAEEVADRLVGEILQTEYASPKIGEQAVRAFQEQGYWSDEVTQYHKDGHAIPILSSTVLFKDEKGQAFGIVAVNHDFTERKKADLALQQALRKEKELSELKSRFVSMASHEFRTPLAAILATTDTLSAYRSKLTEDQIEGRLSKIREQIEHLKDIMDDVLQLARMQARRVEFKPEMLDLDLMCRDIIEEFHSYGDLRHEIEYTCDSTLQPTKADKKLMRQIISNLMSNAIKYSPSNKPIRIHLAFTAEAVILSVSDQGIGIPDSDQEHLFEPFHRGANVGSISGTGLGLVIAKESVEMHGGTIAVESGADTGTTFTVRVPIIVEGDDPTPKPKYGL